MIKNLQVLTDENIKIVKSEVHSLVKQLKKELNFTIVDLPINIVDQSTILKVNTEYLEHNFTTDIITFNYSGENDNLEGEIFISYIDALGNAKKYSVSLENEIARLVIHGILHLLGYDDMTKEEKRKMKSIENKLVDKFSNELKSKIIINDC